MIHRYHCCRKATPIAHICCAFLLLTLVSMIDSWRKVANAFVQGTSVISNQSRQATRLRRDMASDDDRVAGSFFHPVPSGDENNDDDESKSEVLGGLERSSNLRAGETDGEGDVGDDEFQRSFEDLIKQRNSKSRASSPSTVGGIPTSKTKVLYTLTGFGVPRSRSTSPKSSSMWKRRAAGAALSSSFRAKQQSSYIGIGPPDKPINDVNNPEYDDQGYTLYADEETGEKSRVFEALVNYPCEFKVKIVGANEGAFAPEMVQLVADSCRVAFGDVKWKQRRNGKWTSVTVNAPVESAEMLYELYENIDRDPRVKFKF